jgi:hypothetical protein
MAYRQYLGGITDTVIHTETDGTTYIEERQDCEAIFDLNQRKRDHRYSSASPEGFVHEIANVPMVIYQQKCQDIGQQLFAEPDIAMELILKDPAYSRCLAAPKVRDPHIIIRGAR